MAAPGELEFRVGSTLYAHSKCVVALSVGKSNISCSNHISSSVLEIKQKCANNRLYKQRQFSIVQMDSPVEFF